MDEIQFGQLEESEPLVGVRPDQDKHFVVAECGEVANTDLPIFVDLDVMRDMEAHARSNTRVELGGVMLGHQFVDEQGKPFVLVTDSLRARHYEATKGSFKFTHETWSQITLERKQFKSDLEMVGWYHTHPGWSVFLSGMDLFICDNFFNRPLDVALVIDPCADDRGWFQWNDGDPPKTRPTGGFLIMTNRYRSAELQYFKNLYDKSNGDPIDPRYAYPGFGAQGGNRTGTGTDDEMAVDDMDPRKPLYDMALMSMMFVQLALAGLIAWKLVSPAGPPANEVTQQMAKLGEIIEQKGLEQQVAARDEAYRDILGFLVSKETGKPGLVEEFVSLREERRVLKENIQGQLARARQAELSEQQIFKQLSSESKRTEKLKNELKVVQGDFNDIRVKYDALLDDKIDENGSQPTMANRMYDWLPYAGAGLLALTLGLIGYYVGGYRARMDDDYDFSGPEPTIAPATPTELPPSGAPDSISDSSSGGQDESSPDAATMSFKD